RADRTRTLNRDAADLRLNPHAHRILRFPLKVKRLSSVDAVRGRPKSDRRRRRRRRRLYRWRSRRSRGNVLFAAHQAERSDNTHKIYKSTAIPIRHFQASIMHTYRDTISYDFLRFFSMMATMMTRKAPRRGRYSSGEEVSVWPTMSTTIRSNASNQNARAKNAKRRSRVVFQNFRKNKPIAMHAIAIAPLMKLLANPLIPHSRSD